MELILETKKVKRSEYDLVITKTVYKLPISQTTVHLASPRDNGGNQMIRTQISKSKIQKQLYRRQNRYPGVDLKCDHNSLVGEYSTKLEVMQRTKQPKLSLRKPCLHRRTRNIKDRDLKNDETKPKSLMIEEILSLMEERGKQNNNLTIDTTVQKVNCGKTQKW